MADKYSAMREAAVKRAQNFGHVIPEMFAHCINCGAYTSRKLYATCVNVIKRNQQS